MLMQLLTSATTSASTSAGAAQSNPYGWILWVVIIALVVVMFIFNSRSQKKRQKETQEMLDAIKPGNKVKTIGGICGVVVEVCKEDGTFVLETGTQATGKSYLKFDRQAVYQTDAVVAKDDKKADKKDDKVEDKAEEKVESVDAPVEEVKDEKAE